MPAATDVRVPLGRVLALGGLSALGPLALDLYLPALPQIAEDLRVAPVAGPCSAGSCCGSPTGAGCPGRWP